MLTKSKKINIINSLDSWFVPKKKIVDIMRFVADVLKIDGELDLLLTDDKTIRKYNKRYRSIDRATDVLSFSVSDNVFVLPEEKVFGNIIISWEQLKLDTREFEVDIDEMMARLIIHSVLHLSGYDHIEEKQRKEMQKEETRLLNLYKERLTLA